MNIFDWLFNRNNINEDRAPERTNTLPVGIVPEGEANDTYPMSDVARLNPDNVFWNSYSSPQQQARSQRYKDIELMDRSDTAHMLDAVLHSCLLFERRSNKPVSFKVTSPNKRIKKILDTAIEDSNLQTVVIEIFRDMIKYGDAFAEPLYDGSSLAGMQCYPPGDIFVGKDDKNQFNNQDVKGQLPSAYRQRHKGVLGVAGWHSWEMVHFKYFFSTKLLYSQKGMLDDLLFDWRKLQTVEYGMVVTRVTRSSPKRIHYLDYTDKSQTAIKTEMAQYISAVTGKILGRKRSTPEGLPVADDTEDYFMSTGYQSSSKGELRPMLNKIELQSPSLDALANLGDVHYLRQKVWSKVPGDVVGIKNENGNLNGQNIAYNHLCLYAQTRFLEGLTLILDQVLLAKGILNFDYSIVLPAISVGTDWQVADARFKDSMTDRNNLEMNTISRRFALKKSYNMTDDEIDDMWKEIEAEKNSGLFDIIPITQGGPSTTPPEEKPVGNIDLTSLSPEAIARLKTLMKTDPTMKMINQGQKGGAMKKPEVSVGKSNSK